MDRNSCYIKFLFYAFNLGKTFKEVMKLKKGVARIQWSVVNPSGISIPFDGVPFMCVGTVIYQCHQGDDIDAKTKQRRQEERDKKEVKSILN
jgi:hypothetical protein